MKKLFLLMFTFALLPTCLFAVDGQVLISQASITAAGGFPFVISQPGSYKLAGNLTPPIGKDAVHINSNNVTLDVNGFTIGSPACVPNDCISGGYCVLVDSGHQYYHITVRSGDITGMFVGLFVNGDSFTVEDLHVQSTPYGTGIEVFSSTGASRSNVLVRRNTIDGASYGLLIYGSEVVTENTFSNNYGGAKIFSTNAGALIMGNSFSGNAIPWISFKAVS